MGASTSWVIGQPSPPPTIIDDTLTIEKVDDLTLSFSGDDLEFATSSPGTSDTVHKYTFFEMTNYTATSLSFNKPFDDTLYYVHSSRFGHGGGSGTGNQHRIPITEYR